MLREGKHPASRYPRNSPGRTCSQSEHTPYWARKPGAMTKGRTVLLAFVALSLVGAACGNATSKAIAGGTGDPGVTATSIQLGSIANLTGVLSSDFAGVVNGVKAYFDMVNAAGGVDGRKLDLAFQYDDQGNPTTDLTDAEELLEQDHVFAVVGVGTPFFGGASYLAHEGVPTFGYMVGPGWSDGPGLFADYGSDLDYSTAEMGWAWVANQWHATSVGVIAYGVAQSADACQAAINGFRSFGITLGFSDLDYGIGADPTPDVLQMKAHHVDMVLTCLDVSGNIAFAQAMDQNGLDVHQLWENGYDRSTLQQYGSLLNGVTVGLQHVPFEAPAAFPGVYPGMETYLREMAKYEPASEYDEVALDGWINAAQFVAGLQAVGRDLTQRKLVTAINEETDFTADGLMTPQNWTDSHTSPGTGPFCASYVQAENGKWVPTLIQGTSSVFTCFNRGSDVPVPPAPGTPGT